MVLLLTDLPDDIHHLIQSSLAQESRDLRALALVCRSFRSYPQSLLFKRITLTPRVLTSGIQDVLCCTRLLSVLTENPALVEYIREIRLLVPQALRMASISKGPFLWISDHTPLLLQIFQVLSAPEARVTSLALLVDSPRRAWRDLDEGLRNLWYGLFEKEYFEGLHFRGVEDLPRDLFWRCGGLRKLELSRTRMATDSNSYQIAELVPYHPPDRSKQISVLKLDFQHDTYRPKAHRSINPCNPEIFMSPRDSGLDLSQVESIGLNFPSSNTPGIPFDISYLDLPSIRNLEELHVRFLGSFNAPGPLIDLSEVGAVSLTRLTIHLENVRTPDNLQWLISTLDTIPPNHPTLHKITLVLSLSSFLIWQLSSHTDLLFCTDLCAKLIPALKRLHQRSSNRTLRRIYVYFWVEPSPLHSMGDKDDIAISWPGCEAILDVCVTPTPRWWNLQNPWFGLSV